MADSCGPQLPMEVWSQVLPLAFDTLGEAANLMRVCRAFQLEGEREMFWSVWLAREYQRLVQLLPTGLQETITSTYESIPWQDVRMCHVVQSKRMGVEDGWGCSVGVHLYEGQWQSNQKGGLGIIYYADGDRYKGYLLDGTFHGTGTYIWKSGMIYEGEIVDTFKRGAGSFRFTDGSCFVGQFRGEYDEDLEADVTLGDGEWTKRNGESQRCHLITTGFEWAQAFMDDDQPIFRLELESGEAFGVLPSLGAPVRLLVFFALTVFNKDLCAG